MTLALGRWGWWGGLRVPGDAKDLTVSQRQNPCSHLPPNERGKATRPLIFLVNRLLSNPRPFLGEDWGIAQWLNDCLARVMPNIRFPVLKVFSWVFIHILQMINGHLELLGVSSLSTSINLNFIALYYRNLWQDPLPLAWYFKRWSE